MSTMMAAKLETAVWQVETLTPLFIGAGDFHNTDKSGVVLLKGEALVLDERRWAAYAAKQGWLDDLAAGLARPGFDLGRWLCDRLGRLGGPDRIAAWLQQEKLVHYRLPCRHDRVNDYRPFIKNSEHQPYVPGSSLKGVVRSAVVAAFLAHDDDLRQRLRSNLERVLTGDKRDKRPVAQVNEQMLNALMQPGLELKNVKPNDPLRSMMRAVRIADSPPLGLPGECLDVRVKNDYKLKDGQIKTIPVFREMVRPGAELRFAVSLDHHWLTESAPFQSLDELLRIVQQHGAAMAKWLQEIHPRDQLSADGANLCLGGGAGFQSKSLVYALYADDKDKALEMARLLLKMGFGHTNTGKGYQRPSKARFVPHVLKYGGPSGRDDGLDDGQIGWCRLDAATT